MNVTQGTDSYTYFLNVCGQLGIPCGKEHENHEAVCQVNNKDDHSRGKSLGDAYHKTLKYAKLRLSDQIIVVVKVSGCFIVLVQFTSVTVVKIHSCLVVLIHFIVCEFFNGSTFRKQKMSIISSVLFCFLKTCL